MKEQKKRKRSKRHCQWFVAARHNHAHTNEVIARFLSGRCDFPQEGVRCADGKVRNPWPCTFEDVLSFNGSKASTQGDFEFLRQLEDEKCPRLVPRFFFEPRNKKIARKIRDRLGRHRSPAARTA